MNPIDLRALFGDRYRISHDPAAFHEPGGRKDPWLDIIPCQKGHIFPHSNRLLALWWQSSSRLDRVCPALRLYQDGDEEKVYLFRPADFLEVTRIVRPKRRRRLNPAQLLQATQRLRSSQSR